MKARVSPQGAAIVTIVAIFAIISGIFLINYAEAWFLVVLGWILVPVLLKKVYDRLTERRTSG